MSWPEILTEFAADEKDLARRYPLDFAPETEAAQRRWLSGWVQRAEATPATSLSDQVEKDLFAKLLARRSRELATIRTEDQYRDDWLPFWRPLTSLVSQDRRSTSTIENFVEALQAALAAEEPEETPRTGNAIALRDLRALREEWKTWLDFYETTTPSFDFHLGTMVAKINERLEAKEKTLSDLQKTGLDPRQLIPPVGRERLEADLLDEGITTSLEDLLDRAKKEQAWCLHQLTEASKALGCDSWQEGIEFAKQRSAPTGEQADYSCSLASEAVEWVSSRDLITVPPLCDETWTIVMIDEERQKVSPFYLGGPTLHVSSPTSKMTAEEKRMSQRANNFSFSRAVVHHELIPGHALQYFMTERYQRHRRLFYTPFWMEGWTLHWEMLLFEEGFQRGPEDTIGMMFWRLHRAVRVLFSFHYHLGMASAGECVEALVHEVGHERSTAEAEVRRSFNGEWPPLYQAAYLLGGIQMHNLYRERVAAGWTPKQFHDFVMHQNMMPVESLAQLARGTLEPQPPLIERNHLPA